MFISVRTSCGIPLISRIVRNYFSPHKSTYHTVVFAFGVVGYVMLTLRQHGGNHRRAMDPEIQDTLLESMTVDYSVRWMAVSAAVEYEAKVSLQTIASSCIQTAFVCSTLSNEQGNSTQKQVHDHSDQTLIGPSNSKHQV